MKRILKEKGSEFNGNGKVTYYDSGNMVNTDQGFEKFHLLMDFLDKIDH
jgi:hypothetical protein